MKELIEKIGKRASFKVEGLTFKVEIADVRKAFGRVDYLILPLVGQGSGEKWVSQERIKDIEQWKSDGT